VKKKVLYFISSPAPSSVVRGEVFKNSLNDGGFHVNFYYNYSKRLNRLADYLAKNKILSSVIGCINLYARLHLFFKRQLLMRSINNYEGIIIIKYIDSNFLSKMRKIYSGKILYDFDDAIWLNSFFGQQEFEKIIGSVDYVSCDNFYLHDKAKLYNNNVFVLNGPSQLEKFDQEENKSSNPAKIILGWVGSPSTLFYLYSIYDALEEVGRRFENVELTILGSGYDPSRVPDFEVIKVNLIPTYDQAEMIRHIKAFDIGIYPLFKNELSLGRGALKATLYMSSKIPAVCALIGGENEKLIDHRVNGCLANGTQEWVDVLSELITNEKLRNEIGKKGHEFVKRSYSLNACYTQLYNNFLSKL
jgi:glycosyltransferase involved in cell wall biosynthesis